MEWYSGAIHRPDVASWSREKETVKVWRGADREVGKRSAVLWSRQAVVWRSTDNSHGAAEWVCA